MNHADTEEISREALGHQFEAAREADREWREARLARISAHARRGLALADLIERRGGMAIKGLGLALGSVLIAIGLYRAGPYFKADHPELFIGGLVIISSIFVPATLSSAAARVRARVERGLKREGVTVADLRF